MGGGLAHAPVYHAWGVLEWRSGHTELARSLLSVCNGISRLVSKKTCAFFDDVKLENPRQRVFWRSAVAADFLHVLLRKTCKKSATKI